MNKNRIFRLLFLAVFVSVVFIYSGREADAASAKISITASQNSFVKGDTVYVIIKISSSDAMSGFQGYFTYDNKVLMYVTGGSVISGNDDSFLIDDMNYSDSGTYQMKYSVKFMARKAGSTEIVLKKPYAAFSYEDSTEMSVSYNSLKVVVKGKASKKDSDKTVSKPTATPQSSEMPKNSAEPEPTVASKYVNSSLLKSLSVDGMGLSPEFEGNIFKYSGVVTTNEKKLKIKYQPEDSAATVKILGNKKLKKGKNTIRIVVIGRDGSTSTYRLVVRVTRESVNAEGKTQVRAVAENGNTVIYYDSKYTVTEVESQDEIPEGFGATQFKMNGQIVDAYALESDTNHEYLLIYCKHGDDEPEFYLYDTNEDSFMPYIKVQAWYRSVVNNAVVQDNDENLITIKKQNYLIGVMVIICLLMLIGMISIYIHFKD